jgi:hypothetical protein
MKQLCLAAAVLVATMANAQNGAFNTSEFSDAFRKLYADAPKGFAAYKGAYTRMMGSFFSIHQCKSPLPGADSAIVLQPVSVGHPSVTHYFKPSPALAAAQQRETALNEIVKNLAGKTLYAKKEVDSLGKFIFYRTRLYNQPGANVFDLEMETYTVLENKKYHVVLVVYGKTPPPTLAAKSNLPPETNLQQKINDLMTAMNGFFVNEKGKQVETTQYYTAFETVSLLYGQAGKIKERKFETSISFSLGSQQLNGPAEAKDIYEKLKAAFLATGRFTYKPETVEGSRTWMFASETVGNFKVASFTMVLEYYNDPYSPSVSVLLTKKRL